MHRASLHPEKTVDDFMHAAEFHCTVDEARIRLAGVAVHIAKCCNEPVLKRLSASNELLHLQIDKASLKHFKVGIEVLEKLQFYADDSKCDSDFGQSVQQSLRDMIEGTHAKLRVLEQKLARGWADALTLLVQSLESTLVPDAIYAELLASFDKDLTVQHLIDNPKLDSSLLFLKQLTDAQSLHSLCVAQLPSKKHALPASFMSGFTCIWMISGHFVAVSL